MASRAKANSYDQLKEFQGKRYTGMKVGRKHRWKYDAGDWTEKKVTPDKWDFGYSVVKRRAGKAPEGSGAPVGTAYRWLIVASQVVTKLDANSYQTDMVGVKYKLAHKRADKETWSASEKAQRKALAKVLREMLADLESPADTAAAAADGDGDGATTALPEGERHDPAADGNDANGHDGADGAGGHGKSDDNGHGKSDDGDGRGKSNGNGKSNGVRKRATPHSHPIPQTRKRGTTRHVPRPSGAHRRATRAARR